MAAVLGYTVRKGVTFFANGAGRSSQWTKVLLIFSSSHEDKLFVISMNTYPPI
jgi:hypothetical protein